MTAQTVSGREKRNKARSLVTLPLIVLLALVAGATTFVAYVLWPTWPSTPIPIDAPSIPITVAGVLFDVPPAAIRAAVQRHPGPHERIDLDFMWPLMPPQADEKASGKPIDPENAAAAAAERVEERLFVTISSLGPVLPPLERLRTIYPRYIEAQASAGRDGLAILAFRTATPYEGEDLVYLGSEPEKFFARCTRAVWSVPGTCLYERVIDAAQITLRFPRDWLVDWRKAADGFDRLIAQLHPQAR